MDPEPETPLSPDRVLPHARPQAGDGRIGKPDAFAAGNRSAYSAAPTVLTPAWRRC